VTDTTAPIAENPRTSTAQRIGWAILIVATLYVCYFSHLGAVGFVGPDEPRYAWIARAMVETGDWVTPRLYGKPWFEKPVLYYWGAALCFKLFGVSEAAARLPSAISALFATLALAWLALRLYGAETARWLLLLLPTTVGMMGFSHAAATDMPFSGMLTIAMVSAAVVLGLTRDENTPILPRTPWLALVLFGLFLGLAVLAKGPAAIILSGGAVFSWALITRRWRDAFRLLHPAAVASSCLTALPWYILCARRNPDFFRIFIIEHNFKRFLTPEFQHTQPFWYFGPIALIGLLPWVLWLWWYLSSRRRAILGNTASASTTFLSVWGLFPLLFFTLSSSKLPGYILPTLAPLAVLIAVAVVQAFESRSNFAPCLVVCAGLLDLFCALWASYDLFTYRSGGRIHWTIFFPALVMRFYVPIAGIGGLAVIGAALTRRPRLGQLFAVITMLLTIATAYDALIELNRYISPRSVISDIEQGNIGNTYVFKMPRGWHYALNFYVHREVPEWTPATRGNAIVVTNEAGLAELKKDAEILKNVSPFSPETQILKVRSLADRPSDGRQPH
jgi:4-amino-4-deoxy-L-arabinose transferase-like glycosyltransferase